MLSEAQIRGKLKKTARDILSMETWPVLESALFLGYSPNHMYLVIDRENLRVIQIGGRKHLYAIEIFYLFERTREIEFPDLAAKWYADFRIDPPPAAHGRR